MQNAFKLLVIILLSSFAPDAFGSKIKCTINGLPGSTIHLGRYYGSQISSVDSLVVDMSGRIEFNTQGFKSGLYSLVLPNRFNYDFLYKAEANVNIQINNGEFVVNGDRETEAFEGYRQTLFYTNGLKQCLSVRAENNEGRQDSLTFINGEQRRLDAKMLSYYADQQNSFKNTLYAELLGLMKPIGFNPSEIPGFQKLSEDQKRNRSYQHVIGKYRKELSNVSDDVVRTPFYESRLNDFFNRVIIQVPDSISNEAVYLVEQHLTKPSLFQFTTNYLFKYAINSNVMGIDGLLVELANRYYLSGKAEWVNEDFLAKLGRRVAITEPTVMGKTAPELSLQSWIASNGYLSLKEQKNKYTILVFWEPDCNFCKESIPYIQKAFKKHQLNGVGVFAVNTQFDKGKWEQFIVDEELMGWIHVFDPTKKDPYKRVYDISGTPAIYILDVDKKIVAKKFSATVLPQIIDRLVSHGSIY